MKMRWCESIEKSLENTEFFSIFKAFLLAEKERFELSRRVKSDLHP